MPAWDTMTPYELFDTTWGDLTILFSHWGSSVRGRPHSSVKLP